MAEYIKIAGEHFLRGHDKILYKFSSDLLSEITIDKLRKELRYCRNNDYYRRPFSEAGDCITYLPEYFTCHG